MGDRVVPQRVDDGRDVGAPEGRWELLEGEWVLWSEGRPYLLLHPDDLALIAEETETNEAWGKWADGILGDYSALEKKAKKNFWKGVLIGGVTYAAGEFVFNHLIPLLRK